MFNCVSSIFLDTRKITRYLSRSDWHWRRRVNPLNAAVNPICHLLALLGARHILHVSRIRVNDECYHYGLMECDTCLVDRYRYFGGM